MKHTHTQQTKQQAKKTLYHWCRYTELIRLCFQCNQALLPVQSGSFPDVHTHTHTAVPAQAGACTDPLRFRHVRGSKAPSTGCNLEHREALCSCVPFVGRGSPSKSTWAKYPYVQFCDRTPMMQASSYFRLVNLPNSR